MKQLAKSALRSLGLRLYREAGLPPGIDLARDLRRITGGDPRVRTLVDVGANVGQSAQRFLALFPDCKVVSCEPAPAAFDALTRRFKDEPRVRCERIALAATAGAVPFLLDAPLAETNRVAGPGEVGSLIVQAETLDGLAARLGLLTIDLLKIDTEGNEAEVLGGAAGLLRGRCIRFIFAECDFMRGGHGHTDFDALRGVLEPAGATFLGLYDVNHYGGRLGFCNALFGFVDQMPLA